MEVKMVRLKPGEYIKMSPEEQKQHRKELRENWLSKPGNRERAAEINKKCLQAIWLKKKTTPVERVCTRCGKTVMLTGNRTICDECRNTPSKTKLKREEREARNQTRVKRNEEILRLNSIGCFTQKQIAIQVGTCQEVVSKVLRNAGINKQKHPKRTKDE